MSLRNQIYIAYHDDSFLRNQLLTSVDIRVIQVPQGEIMARTSNPAVHRVAYELSNEENSSGSSSSFIIHYESDEID